MKIFLACLSGHDKTESTHYRRVLGRLGHEVFPLAPPAWAERAEDGLFAEPGLDPRTTLEGLVRIAGFAPDLFLYVEPGRLIPRGIERAPFPTACVLSDVHREAAPRLALARFFDHVFLYHRNHVRRFTEHPAGHVHWLPYACDLDVVRPLGVERDLDVAFVGQPLPDGDRARLLGRLRERFAMNEPRVYGQAEVPRVYSRARIVVNLPLADDLNFRTFEAMSCGALLVTRRMSNGQEVLFEEGTHFVAFATEAELLEKVDYYLAHEEERERIAAAGLAEVQLRHRLDQRMEALLAVIRRDPRPAAPVRGLQAPQVDRLFAWLYEYHRLVEPGLALIKHARAGGRPWVPLAVPVCRSIVRAAFR